MSFARTASPLGSNDHTLSGPPRFEVKKIRPSGENAGAKSIACPSVNLTFERPSADMTQMP
jgi:hypothetical protein